MTETETRYLVVGGGMTGDAACKGIREHDPDGAVTLVGAETHPPYKRPPLTKGLWSGGDEEKIWRGTDQLDVDLRLGRTVVSVDRGRAYRDGRRRRARTATRSCCSRRVAGRGICPAAPTGSCTTARSTTTGAPRPRRGRRPLRRDRRRLHRLGDRRRTGLERLRGDDASSRTPGSARVSSRASCPPSSPTTTGERRRGARRRDRRERRERHRADRRRARSSKPTV